MVSDKGLVLDAVREAAKQARIIDEDLVNIEVFEEALAAAKIVNGKVIGAKDAVQQMRERKPAWFRATDWAKAPAKEFAAETERLCEHGAVPSVEIPAEVKEIDAGSLDAKQFGHLTTIMRGGNDPLAVAALASAVKGGSH